MNFYQKKKKKKNEDHGPILIDDHETGGKESERENFPLLDNKQISRCGLWEGRRGELND